MHKIKTIFFDLETTGTDPEVHGIYEIGMIIELGGTVMQKLSWQMCPPKECEWDLESFKIRPDISMKKVKSYPAENKVFQELLKTLNAFISSRDTKDKFFLAGYNNAKFDNQFLWNWFVLNNTNFTDYFWANALDGQVLATEHLKGVRHKMKNFQLATVAEYLGITPNKSKVHTALYDAILARKIYYLITKPNKSQP